MGVFVALNTQRNNIKPVFLGIGPMVVLLGRLAARALQRIGAWKSANSDGVGHSPYSFDLIWVAFGVFGIGSHMSGLALSSGEISFVGSFACWAGTIGLLVGLLAILAIAVMAVLVSSTSIKFRNGFCVLANRAGLCYSGFRHGCLLLINSYRLEPLAAQTVGGSFYYSERVGRINHKVTRRFFL